MSLIDRIRRSVVAFREETSAGATLKIEHRRPYDFDEKRGILRFKDVDPAEVVRAPRFSLEERLRGGLLSEEEVHNILLNVGRVQMHKQCYGTSGLATNGLNYIALTNDSGAPAATDTTLASEIVANGLSRAQGTVTLATGSGNQTTVAKTFTCATAPQAAQKAALFDASSSGNMNHEVLFTQRSLQIGDDLVATYTCQLG